jgi:predicted phosphoribosyltransferase
MFNDRIDAGRQLGDALKKHPLLRPLLLALPRGGVVVGAEAARRLGCELDVLLVKKLRAPDNPELALGAIDEGGQAYLNDPIVRATGADRSYLERETSARRLEIADQRRLYRSIQPRIPADGRTVILVDDGLATGATMIAAVQAISRENPQELVVAVPVAPPEAVRMLEGMSQVNAVICLHSPEWFSGVSQCYQDFTQVSDAEVLRILKEFPESLRSLS